MPINEIYTGSRARGFFQTMPTRLEYALEPREQLAIFDWDRSEKKDLSDAFEDMEKLDVTWGTFVDTTTIGDRWSNKTFTTNQISISRPDVTTVTYIPEIE